VGIKWRALIGGPPGQLSRYPKDNATSDTMTDPISDSWDRISAWLRSNAPATLQLLQSPATQEQLDHLASQMSLELPDEFKDFYRISFDDSFHCAPRV
jgi:hypothetical protein